MYETKRINDLFKLCETLTDIALSAGIKDLQLKTIESITAPIMTRLEAVSTYADSLVLKNCSNIPDFISISNIIRTLVEFPKDVKFKFNNEITLTVSSQMFQETLKELNSFELNESEIKEIASIISIVKIISTLHLLSLNKIIPECETKITILFIVIRDYIYKLDDGVIAYFKDPRKVGATLGGTIAAKLFWNILNIQ